MNKDSKPRNEPVEKKRLKRESQPFNTAVVTKYLGFGNKV